MKYSRNKKILYLTTFLLATAALFGWAKISWATTRNAASCNLADVQAQVDAASPGDTIVIPECDSGVTWTASLNVSKPVSIIGNGSTGSHRTKIISYLTYGAIIVSGINDTTNLMRISGIYFDTPDRTGVGDGRYYGTYIVFNPSNKIWKLRIDHNYFHLNQHALFVAGDTRGVVDSNTYYNVQLANSNDAPRPGDNTGTTGCDGDQQWADADAFHPGMSGNGYQMYYEGNTIYTTDGLQKYDEWIGTGDGGGAFVARYNTYLSTVTSSESYNFVMGHGSVGGYWGMHGGNCGRSPTTVEIYNNDFTGYGPPDLFASRGGSYLVHHNRMTTPHAGTGEFIRLQEEKFYSVFSPLRLQGPGEDQVFDTFIWENYVNGELVTSVADIDPRNSECTSSGYYYSCCTGPGTGYCDDVIALNKQYFMHAPAATGGRAIFTGRMGGSSSYPTGPNDPYPSGGNMTFSPSGPNAYYGYQPYTCPHPLTGYTGSCDPTKYGTAAYNIGYTPPTPTCGDATCNGSETCSSCPTDCGVCPPAGFAPNQPIQAEAGTLSSMQTSTSGSDTYIYTDTTNQGSASYPFDITTPGPYKLLARVNSNNDPGSNSFYVGLDNEAANGSSTYTYDTVLTPSFTWDDVNRRGNGTTASQYDPMIFTLTQGTHTFTFYGKEANTQLDQIELVPYQPDTTAPNAPTGLVIQ